MNTGGGSDSQKEDVGLETGCPGVIEMLPSRDCRQESKFGRMRSVSEETASPIV